jgi:polygalacturonase
MWNLGLRYDKNVTVSNYRVVNPSNSPNTDGIDPVGTRYLTVTDADIDTGDDNIAIKSGLPGVPPGAYYAPPYNLPRVPTSNVSVYRSVFRRGHGLSVGSETVNGIQHIRANYVQFLGTDNGFRIKTGRDRGNQIFDMIIQNLQMTDVPTPISLSEYYPTIPGVTQPDISQPEPPETRPFVHGIRISNVNVTNPKTVRDTNVTGGLIIGLPESPIYNVRLNNINISTSTPGGTYMRLRNVDQLRCSNVAITPLNQGSPNFDQTFDNEGGLTNVIGCDISPSPPSPPS